MSDVGIAGSLTRCELILIKYKNIKNQNSGRQSRELGKSLGRERNFEKVCLSLERNIGKDEFQVSEGSEFQSREPMTEKVLLPSNDRTK